MERIQRRRYASWRAPAGAIYVGKPTPWANPYAIYIYGWKEAVELYRQDLAQLAPAEREVWLAPLRQATALMCWCPLDKPCHADVLLEYLDRPAPGVERIESMTYHYATKRGSPFYHLLKPDRNYSLCELWVRTGKYISPEPPAGKKECPKCGRVLRKQPYNAGPSTS